MERTCTALFKVAKTGSQSQSLSPIKAITEQVKKKCDYTSLVAQMVKNLPTVRETQVQSLGREDPLEKGMATYSSILAWGIPWTEEPGGLQTRSLQKSQTLLSD